MARVTWRAVLLIACLGLAASSAVAATVDEPRACFDAKVTATLVGQTPTVAPRCDDCIIMRWPWFLDYEVDRVLEGSLKRGPLTVLSVEHTYYRDDLGSRLLFLRRNDVGGFNRVRRPDHGEFRLCPASTPPARAFIRPAPGRTLEDLRREGEDYYGKHPE